MSQSWWRPPRRRRTFAERPLVEDRGLPMNVAQFRAGQEVREAIGPRRVQRRQAHVAHSPVTAATLDLGAGRSMTWPCRKLRRQTGRYAASRPAPPGGRVDGSRPGSPRLVSGTKGRRGPGAGNADHRNCRQLAVHSTLHLVEAGKPLAVGEVARSRDAPRRAPRRRRPACRRNGSAAIGIPAGSAPGAGPGPTTSTRSGLVSITLAAIAPPGACDRRVLPDRRAREGGDRRLRVPGGMGRPAPAQRRVHFQCSPSGETATRCSLSYGRMPLAWRSCLLKYASSPRPAWRAFGPPLSVQNTLKR